MKKTQHVYCVSNKIKYLTPFARKIQRPLFARTNKRTNERPNEWFDCGLLRWNKTQWLRVWHLPHSQIHTITKCIMKSQNSEQSNSSFLSNLFRLLSWYRCVSANANKTAHTHTKCAHSLASKTANVVCLCVCLWHFYLLRCEIQLSKSVIRQRGSR